MERRLHLLALFSLPLLALSWLAPNHYFPWPSFHGDWLAAAALAACAFSLVLSQGRAQATSRLALAACLLSAVPLLQLAGGMIHFGGDAWTATLYLLGLGLAIHAGTLLQRSRVAWLEPFAWTVAGVALVSVVLQLCQLFRLSYFGVFLAEMPPNDRPFANLAQPNQLATLLMLGFVGVHLLYQRERFGRLVLGLTTLVLCLGIAMTQSRTAWLEMGVCLSWMLLMRRRASLRVSRNWLLATAAVFVLLVAVWPALREAMHLAPGRTLQQQAEGGLRAVHWASMLDAIGQQPWLGYGWNQASVAQSRVALDHRATGEMLEHSHNVVLDLLVWNGVPLGLLIVGGLAWWFVRHIRACRDAAAALMLAAIGIVFLHGLVEFPLEYAYFLLPVGLLMGALDAIQPVGRPISVRRPVVLAAMAAAAALLVWTTVEYVQVEENHRVLRFESARIGVSRIESQAPDIVLLTQLREFLRFARTEARRGMGSDELDWMERVAERYGYPPVLFRYALASGINGRPEASRDALARLCKIHPRARCVEAIEAWALMADGQFPELKAVPAPQRP